MDTLYFAAMSRVSSDEQNKGISPTDQIKRILAWAALQPHNFELAQYEDAEGRVREAIFLEDYTGFEYERPEMDIVRDLARRGVIKALIITKTDRFARDEAVFMLLERYFKKHGVRLFSVEEGEFTPGAVNPYVAAFQRARAEDDAQTAKKRMRSARHAYSRAGIPQSQGHALFGYVKTGNKRETAYVIAEEQAEVIRLIFSWYVVEGWTVYRIIRELNESGIPSPAVFKKMKHHNLSGKWVDSTVRDILKNPAYKGQLIIYQTATMDDGTKQAIPEAEQVAVSIPYIIEEEQWEQASYKLSHSRDKWLRREKVREYLLTGMLRCHCTAAMTGTSLTTHGRRYYYYRCTSYKREWGRSACSKTQHVNAEALEFTVWDFIERLVADPITTMALYLEDQARIEHILSEAQERIEAIDDLLRDSAEQKRRLNHMFQHGRCEEDYFNSQWSRLDREEEALLREREKAENILRIHAATTEQVEELENIGEDLQEGELTFAKKRRTLERLRTNITMLPDEEDNGADQWLVVEVLGYQRRVCLKNGSAR